MMNEVDGMRQEDYNVSNRICTILYVVLIDGDQILFFFSTISTILTAPRQKVVVFLLTV